MQNLTNILTGRCVPCLFLSGQDRTVRRRPENSKDSLTIEIWFAEDWPERYKGHFFSGSRMWTTQLDLQILMMIAIISFNSCLCITWLVFCFVNRIIFVLSLSWLWHRLVSLWHTSLGMLCMATITCDTYAAMEVESHSVMSSKSWMTKSGQQWIMTRKCRSQRLRISCQITLCKTHSAVSKTGSTGGIIRLTSVSRTYKRYSTTTIFLTP